MQNEIKTDSNHIALTKRAALRHGQELTTAQAHNHAAKIAEWMGFADEGEEYGQDFWTAAKQYFLN